MALLDRNSCSSLSSSQKHVGTLCEWNEREKTTRTIDIHAKETLLIGRGPRSCQIVINDPRVSKKHLRIYAIIYDQDNPDHVAPLIYAQDLSSNGTLWNGRRIGRRSGSVLLNDGDTLKLCDHITFTFRALKEDQNLFSRIQSEETKEFQKEYLITNRLLGSGAYGRVHMAVNQRTGTQLACKIVSLSAIKSQLRPSVNCGVGQPYTRRPAANGDTYAQTAKLQNWSKRQQLTQKIESKLKIYDREVEILQKLRHPNIIGVERVFKTENTLYIFQDLIPAGDLFSYLEFKRGKLHDAEAAVIVRQIAIALDYLHDNNIVHRDLKPDNVLMTSLASGCRIVLTDFGCARHIPRETNRMVSMMGTFEYTAPEIDRSCLKKGYTKSVDLWSLGCVTVVLLTGGSPFQHPDTESYSRDLARECNLGRLEEIEEWFHVGRRAKDFVRKLLVLDENQRMTAKDAVKHDWFTNPFHKRAFEEIYQKGISEWKPRPNGNFNLRDSCYSDSESQIGLSLNNGLPSCNRSGSHIGLALDIKGQTDCASSRDKVTGVEEHAREQEQSLFTMPSVPGRKDKSPFHCHMHGSFDELTFEGRNQTQSELELQGGEAASIQEPNHGVDTDADAGTSSESKKHNSGVRISHQPFYGKLTYTPNKVESPVRLPFSPAAWNKDVGMTKLTRPMGPPNRINACSLRKTLGEPGSILKTLRPNSGALEARSNLRSPVKPSRDQFDQSKKRRRADIFDLEEDVLLQDSKHNAAGQKKRLK